MPTIEFSATTFPIERPFTISVIIQNSETRPTVVFPSIPGFSKRGSSASVTTSEYNSKTVVSQVITQTYQALKPGVYVVAPLRLQINGVEVTSAGVTITVRPGMTTTLPRDSAYLTPAKIPPGSAFLALTTSQRDVFVGEGFLVKLSFFVTENYPDELRFERLDQQVRAIVRRIRPTTVWEENAGINELRPVPVVLNGKKYTEYRLYQATFFALTAQPVALPAVSLVVQRSRPVVAGRPAPAPAPTTFSSQPLRVLVRALPPHPLRNQVAVGQFRLIEGLPRPVVAPGKSAQYLFRIEGEGNITTLPAPTTLAPAAGGLNLFAPEVQQVIDRRSGLTRGRKDFRYYMVAQQPGTFPLANALAWPYFDPQRARYDTLRPQLTVRVTNATNAQTATVTPDTVQTADDGPLYVGLERLDSREQALNIPALVRLAANILIGLMLLATIFVFFRK